MPLCRFGFLFDIDGVIVRGKRVLPAAKDAFELLTDHNGNFQVPALFVTNAGNSLRSSKAKQLSQWLGINVSEEQVVMSHSPLKMFRQFHDKHVLINGQGPIREIAQNIGFKHVTTVEELSACFPYLDTIDHKRRRAAPCAFEDYFPPIEAVVLFGEPVRWEMPLQIILDTLMTDGRPNKAPINIPYPHIPVLACNMDLLFMAEAPTPRFGHGCFLHALEGLYQKITGRELKYTALVGKPSELTYHHADYVLHQQARQLGINGVHTIYCIGDNPETDIYGGNLYARYLQKRNQQRQLQKPQPMLEVTSVKKKLRRAQSDGEYIDGEEEEGELRDPTVGIKSSLKPSEDTEDIVGAIAQQVVTTAAEEASNNGLYTQKCESILVCTGVFSKDKDLFSLQSQRSFNHNHRDFVINPDLKQPTHMVPDVLEAVRLVIEREGEMAGIVESKVVDLDL